MIEDMSEIPKNVPVMTLKDLILFPQAMVPLYIYEEKYKIMLDDLLRGPRLMAIGTLDESLGKELEGEEPPFKVAGLGLIRACNRHPDGTAHMIVQGMTRIRLVGSTSIIPYRQEEIEIIRPFHENLEDISVNERRKRVILKLIEEKVKLTGSIPQEVIGFLEKIDSLGTFLDLSAYAVCSDVLDKQKVLSTISVIERFSIFADILRSENIKLKIFEKIKGKMKDEDIGNN
jgi:ATP-dependent Lon protease